MVRLLPLRRASRDPRSGAALDGRERRVEEGGGRLHHTGETSNYIMMSLAVDEEAVGRGLKQL